MSEEKKIFHCSFCGRIQDEVDFMIAGREANICNGCVEYSAFIILAQRRANIMGRPSEVQFRDVELEPPQ